MTWKYKIQGINFNVNEIHVRYDILNDANAVVMQRAHSFRTEEKSLADIKPEVDTLIQGELKSLKTVSVLAEQIITDIVGKVVNEKI